MAKPALMKRRAIRKDELLEICERQGLTTITEDGKKYLKDWLFQEIELFGHCECGCKRPFIEFVGESYHQVSDGPEYDHRVPNALLYEGDKVDWRALRKSCHDRKTNTFDKPMIAKARRLAGETGQYARRMRRKEAGKAPLLQGRKEIARRQFQTPPDGHSSWGSSRGFKRGYEDRTKYYD